MRPSHSAGFVAMREAPLEQLASLPEQPLAIASLHMPPIRVGGLLVYRCVFQHFPAHKTHDLLALSVAANARWHSVQKFPAILNSNAEIEPA